MTTMQMRQRLQDGGCSGRRLNSFPLVLTRLLLVLSVASCSNGGDSDTFTSRDSLGITIADNVSTPEADAPFWYLSDSPTFDVGLVERQPQCVRCLPNLRARWPLGGHPTLPRTFYLDRLSMAY